MITREETKEGLKILSEVFEFIDSKKRQFTIAEVIKYPQLPVRISEAIAYYLILDRVLLPNIECESINFGGNLADIIIKTNINSSYKVEIKATRMYFQYFSDKDIFCDCLIWIDFNEYFKTYKYIKIYELFNPNKFFKNNQKITLTKFINIVGNSVRIINFDLSKL